MKRRLFIGIAVPQDIGKRIDRKMEALSELPIIWTRKENRHITLLFLGWVDDEKLPEIVSDIREVCEGINAFDANVDRISSTPTENPDRIEATGEANEELKNMYNAISQTLDEFAVDRKTFIPHITLGRIRKSKWRALAEKPLIDIPAQFSLPVYELSLFESTMVDGKRTYVAIEVIPLA